MALLEIEQGPIIGSEIPSDGLQPSPPSFLEKIKESPLGRYAGAVVDHPWVAGYWALSNHLISAQLINLYAEMKGIPEESIKLSRAEGVLKVFGPWALKALIDHFAPEIDIDELKRRRGLEYLPPSKRLRKTFRKKSPLLDKGLPALGTDISAPSESEEDRRNLLQERDWAFHHILNTFRDPKSRLITEAFFDRVVILREMAIQFLKAPGERRNPSITCDEMILFSMVIRKSLAREEAPRALEETSRTLYEAITGMARFIDMERKDQIYPGTMPQKALEEQIVALAWGLTSLAKRKTSNGKNAAGEEIKNTRIILGKIKTPDSGFADSLGQALNILELADRGDIPTYSHAWLKAHFEAGQFNPVLTKIVKGDEVTLKLDKDLRLLTSATDKATLNDYRFFSALAIRFPFQDEITIIEGNGIVWVINLEAVREQLLQGSPKSDEAVNNFISLAGESRPIEFQLIKSIGKKPLKLSGRPISSEHLTKRQPDFKIAA